MKYKFTTNPYGQTGEYVIFSQTDRNYANFIQRNFIKFQYLKVK